MPGSLAMLSVNDDAGERRLMHRITLQGVPLD